MQRLECNGWTNYETWNFKLWADNDEPTYKKVQRLVKKYPYSSQNLAMALEELANDEAPELKANFYSDVINASIREINFREIAKSLLEDQQQDHEGNLIT